VELLIANLFRGILIIGQAIAALEMPGKAPIRPLAARSWPAGTGTATREMDIVLQLQHNRESLVDSQGDIAGRCGQD